MIFGNDGVRLITWDEMWDSMIEKVNNAINRYERKKESEGSTLHEVVHSILIDHWTKSSTSPIFSLFFKSNVINSILF